jgi:ribosomal protein S18 acetylase RimI-like enzyme
MENETAAIIEIVSPLGLLRLRPEHADDEAFRFKLFCDSRPELFALLQLGPAELDQLMRFQFRAQTMTYRTNFPKARFDIIELDFQPIGRIVIHRPGTELYIVDQAITPSWRHRGLGTSLMRALIDEAGRAGLPLRLDVASTNDRAMRLYLRLGFVPVATGPVSIEMKWRPSAAG